GRPGRHRRRRHHTAGGAGRPGGAGDVTSGRVRIRLTVRAYGAHHFRPGDNPADRPGRTEHITSGPVRTRLDVAVRAVRGTSPRPAGGPLGRACHQLPAQVTELDVPVL